MSLISMIRTGLAGVVVLTLSACAEDPPVAKAKLSGLLPRIPPRLLQEPVLRGNVMASCPRH